MKFDPASTDRPDFGFFERILGRPIPRPATAPEAHIKIKELLIEAFETKPFDLIRAAGAKQLQSLWSSVGNRADIKAASLDYVVSRLWERDPTGIPATARSGTKPPSEEGVRLNWTTPSNPRGAAEAKPRTPSTNAILFYDASKHGVVGYLRQNITWILGDFQGELVEQNKFISTDYLQEKGVELATTGRFVRQSRVHDGADEQRNNASEGLTTRRTRDVRAELAAIDEITLERDGFAEEEFGSAEEVWGLENRGEQRPETDAEQAQRPKYRALRDFDEIALRSKSRPDVQLFREELDEEILLSPDPETREHQLRGLARKLISSRCSSMPEMEDILAEVDDWPVMDRPFQAHFVEVIDWLNAHPKEMGPAGKPPPMAGAPDPLSSTTQLEIISTPLLKKEQTERAQKMVAEGRLWRLHSTPEILASPHRPDYEFLRGSLGYGTPVIADPEKRMAELHGMGLEFVNALFQGSAQLRSEFRQEFEHWDPRKSLFNEEVAHVITRMVENDSLSPDEVQAVSCSFFSRYREEADPEYVARLEAAQLKAASAGVQQGYLLQEVADDARRPRRERRPSSKSSSPAPSNDLCLPIS